MLLESPVSRKKVYILLLILNIISAVNRLSVFPGMPWKFHFGLFILIQIITTLLWESMTYISRFLEKPFPVASRPVTHIAIQVFVIFILAVVLGKLSYPRVGERFNFQPSPEMKAVVLFLNFSMALVLNLMYFGAIYFKEWKTNLLRAERSQREKAEVRYDSLRNQLNPHFLFNALTSLNSLIFENQQLASDFLQQLSKVYRYTLQTKDQETVVLKTEMEFISHFISLVKTRFGEDVDFKIDINKNALEKGIVPVTMQLLLENALKHNIISADTPLHIRIHADEDYLIVENCLNKKTRVETSNKQGLENLKALYKYLSDKPVEIAEGEKIFTVKIPLL
jgi:two-component system, LytTR family, sensor kinase